jgi:secreted trypsin-like serine protease
MWFLLLTLLPLAAATGRLRAIPVHPRDVLNSPYIINGEDADNGEYPWQGSLQTASGSHTCGCILIDRNWVLTAAHCVGGAGYSVLFGTNSRTNADGAGTVYDITNVYRHEDYVGSGATPNGAYPYDYAILTPGGTIQEGEVVPLTQSNDGTGKTCFISGWGRETDGGPLPASLKEVQIPVISDAECSRIWGNSFNEAVHVCVLDDDPSDGMSGACNGDSGGPLVCDDNGVFHLYGVTSWVYSGCNTDYPSVYARVFTAKDWICTHTNGQVCQ